MPINEVSSRSAVKAQAPALAASAVATSVTPSNVASSAPARAASHPETASANAVLEQDVEQLSEAVQSIRRELNFTIDKETGDTIIKVIDSETKQVIRKIPPQEMLSLLERLGKTGAGLMVDVKT